MEENIRSLMWYFWFKDAYARVPPPPQEFSCLCSKPAPWGARVAWGAATGHEAVQERAGRNHTLSLKICIYMEAVALAPFQGYVVVILVSKKKKQNHKTSTSAKFAHELLINLIGESRKRFFYFTITFKIQVNIPWMSEKRNLTYINQQLRL